MNSRLNNVQLCFCCGRRADGWAVGRPGRLAWGCNQCGIDLVKVGLSMAGSKELDEFEKRACAKVAELVGTTEVTLNKDELAEFVGWAVKEFGDAVRKEIESGAAPF